MRSQLPCLKPKFMYLLQKAYSACSKILCFNNLSICVLKVRAVS